MESSCRTADGATDDGKMHLGETEACGRGRRGARRVETEARMEEGERMKDERWCLLG
jgi:hypothetical protein